MQPAVPGQPALSFGPFEWLKWALRTWGSPRVFPSDAHQSRQFVNPATEPTATPLLADGRKKATISVFRPPRRPRLCRSASQPVLGKGRGENLAVTAAIARRDE